MKSLSAIIISSLIICIFSAVGCEKEDVPFARYENTRVDRLNGDTSIFVGIWHWVYTDHHYGWCENEFYYEYLDPATENVQFTIQFYESGYLHYYKNDSLYSSYRISFEYIDDIDTSSCTHFAIDLDGFDDLSLSGCIKKDTIKGYVPGFLFYAEPGCEQYVNYFVKE